MQGAALSDSAAGAAVRRLRLAGPAAAPEVSLGRRAPHGPLGWFESAGDASMPALLFAAAVGGYTVTDIYKWCQLEGTDIPLRILGSRPGCDLLVATLQRTFETKRTAASIRESMSLSLA